MNWYPNIDIGAIETALFWLGCGMVLGYVLRIWINEKS